jgi:hypothetical protein
MDQFVDRFNGCAIPSGHFSRPSTSILGERALQKTWQFELDTEFDLMCAKTGSSPGANLTRRLSSIAAV